jgi:hypothetical protein
LQEDHFYLTVALETMQYDIKPPYVLSLSDIPRDAEAVAGAKALRLALIRNELGMRFPDGFVVTASAFRYFIEANDLSGRSMQNSRGSIFPIPGSWSGPHRVSQNWSPEPRYRPVLPLKSWRQGSG